jgi:hypothetical protein
MLEVDPAAALAAVDQDLSNRPVSTLAVVPAATTPQQPRCK